MTTKTNYTLTCYGSAMDPAFPPYEREHASLEAAEMEAERIKDVLYEADEASAANIMRAHPAQIEGPGLEHTHALPWNC